MTFLARLFILIIAFAPLPVAAQDAQSAPIPKLLEEVRDLVRKEFYDRNALGPFEQAVESRRGTTQQEVGPSIEQALRALNASHTGRYTSDQVEYYELVDIFRPGQSSGHLKRLFPPDGVVTYAGIGIAPRKIEGRDFILHVYSGSPADRAGLKAGDEIVSVDGKPFAPVDSFKGKDGTKVTMQVRRKADAEPVSIEVPVLRIQPGDMFRDAIRNSARIIEKDGRRIGYVRIWTYAARGVHSVMMDLLSSEPLKSADALVLDLRSRWGGAPPSAAELFVGGAPDMTLTGNDGKVSVASVRWRKPVVALIDNGSRSGIEIYAHALKQAGIKLIGTRTAGAVLAGRGFLLEDDTLLVLAVADVRVDGLKLEGPGVAPDIEVSRDIRYADGADPLLDRALIELERAKVN